MTAAKSLVALVVLTRNNFDDTDECLRSLAAVTYEPTVTIVVDNASTDDSFERLKECWSEGVVWIRTSRNGGIAYGDNHGIVRALDLGADYVCVFNNDIIVEPSFVDTLLAAFDGSPKTALAAPVMLFYYRPELIWFAGVSYNRLLGLSIAHDFRRPVARFARRGESFITDIAPICATMFDQRALREVGLLDERMRLSHDDVDWSLRAAEKGFQCVVVGEPLGRHKISATRGIAGSVIPGPAANRQVALNAYIVGAKHVRGSAWLPFLFGRLVLALPFQLLRMAAAGAWRSAAAYLRGTVEGLLYVIRRHE